MTLDEILNEPGKIVAPLVGTIRETYGIDLVSLDHMPVGFVGIHYQARDSDGNGYFITVYDGSRLAKISANRLAFTLPALEFLKRSGQFMDLTAPLPTVGGRLSAYCEGFPVILYPFVEGHLLAEEAPLSKKTWQELGQLVAKLHGSALHPKMMDPIYEQFTFPFEIPLRQGLKKLETIHPSDKMVKTALRELLLPRRELIYQLLNRLHNLADFMRLNSPPFVICHTDIHPWNVIRTVDRKLLIVDWEGICLAPAEYDLFIFTGCDFKFFMQAYFEAGGQRKLTAEAFSFYFHRRNLEDLTDFVVRILDESGGHDRDRRDLDGIQQDCIAGWENLETAVERMQAELKALLT